MTIRTELLLAAAILARLVDQAIGHGEHVARAVDGPVAAIDDQGRYAVEAMRLGAVDFVPKPFTPDHLSIVVQKALGERALCRENQNLREQLSRHYSFDNIIGKSPSMVQIFESIKKIADSNISVLITGASGTGKELIAQSIHANSRRRGKPFVPINEMERTAYAPIPLPLRWDGPARQSFDDRGELDRGIYAIIDKRLRDEFYSGRGPAMERVDADMRRVQALGGLSDDDRKALVELQGDYAYLQAREIVDGLPERLRQARRLCDQAEDQGTGKLGDPRELSTRLGQWMRLLTPDGALLPVVPATPAAPAPLEPALPPLAPLPPTAPTPSPEAAPVAPPVPPPAAPTAP